MERFGRLDRVSPYQCLLRNFAGRATPCGAGPRARVIRASALSTHTVCYGRLPIRVVSSFSRASVFGDESEQSVFFVGDSSREINSVAEDQHIPQPIKLERRTIGSVDRP